MAAQELALFESFESVESFESFEFAFASSGAGGGSFDGYIHTHTYGGWWKGGDPAIVDMRHWMDNDEAQ